VRLTACPVTVPAAKNLSHTAPFPPAPRSARLPAPIQTGTPARSITVRSPALPADGSVVQPGGIAKHLARAAGEVIGSLAR
jgi:hypothetical protein